MCACLHVRVSVCLSGKCSVCLKVDLKVCLGPSQSGLHGHESPLYSFISCKCISLHRHMEQSRMDAHTVEDIYQPGSELWESQHGCGASPRPLTHHVQPFWSEKCQQAGTLSPIQLKRDSFRHDPSHADADLYNICSNSCALYFYYGT